MAIVDFDAELKDLDGNPLPISLEDRTPTTLRVVAVGAILSPQVDDAGTSGLGYRLSTLAHRIHAGGGVDLDAGDIDLIKKRIERCYPPLVIGQAWDMLEGRASA